MSRHLLNIAEHLSLPRDVVTATQIVYGGKGMGKTNYGSVLAEECARAGLHFAVIDPMGVWWGLRHSATGHGPGIEVLILGGIHGDIPIEPTGGAVVADLVVDEAANVIVDISRRPDGTMWAIADRVRFVRDYCKRLYQRQGEKRRPLLQGIDEAARFIPQVIRKDDSDVAACMGAIAVLVEEGRNVGIGVALITQRSARLNKDVAELADCMIAFRTVGPNSRRAVLDWLGEHVEKEKIKGYDEQLRALPRGSALVVSPGWLEYEGIVAMRARQTFDSSATPRGGKQRRVTGGAKPDLAKYRALMAATIERAKADDPRELKKQIRELEAALGSSTKRNIQAVRTIQAQPKIEYREKPVITEIQLQRLERAAATFGHTAGSVAAAVHEMRDRVTNAVKRFESQPVPGYPGLRMAAEGNPSGHSWVKERFLADPAVPPGEVHVRQSGRPVAKIVGVEAPPPKVSERVPGLKAGARRMATVLATWYPRLLTKTQLGTLASVTPGSGTFYEYLRALVACSLATEDGELVRINESCVDNWRDGTMPAGARAIAQAYSKALKAGARRMLDVLIEIGPDSSIDKASLAHKAQIAPASGTFYEYLRSLTRNGLAIERTNDVTGSDTLFMART